MIFFADLKGQGAGCERVTGRTSCAGAGLFAAGLVLCNSRGLNH